MQTRAKNKALSDHARENEGIYKSMMLRNGWVQNRDGSMTSRNGESHPTWAAAYRHILAGWDSEDDELLFPSLAELTSGTSTAPTARKLPFTKSPSSAAPVLIAPEDIVLFPAGLTSGAAFAPAVPTVAGAARKGPLTRSATADERRYWAYWTAD